MSKALVSGGAGFIGSHIVEILLENNWEVRILDNFSTGSQSNLDHLRKDVEVHLGDVACFDDCAKAVAGVEVVFHQAAIPSVPRSVADPVGTHAANLTGTVNLLSAARSAGVRRLVLASSSAVYGNDPGFPKRENMPPAPASPYAAQKLSGEYYLRVFSELKALETVSLRYFNVFGPRQDSKGDYACLIPRFIKLINQGKRPTINGHGRQTRDFTFVDDVIEANLLAAQTENKDCFGQVFNIGAGRNNSVNQVTKEILKLAKKKIRPIHGPAVVEPKNSLADIEKAKKMLSWQPQVSFKKGLQKTYRYFVENVN